jgi:hypothetical protein
MNIKLDMKDINKILAKAHFKCIFFFNDMKLFICVTGFIHQKDLILTIALKKKRKKSKKHMSMHI